MTLSVPPHPCSTTFYERPKGVVVSNPQIARRADFSCGVGIMRRMQTVKRREKARCITKGIDEATMYREQATKSMGQTVKYRMSGRSASVHSREVIKVSRS